MPIDHRPARVLAAAALGLLSIGCGQEARNGVPGQQAPVPEVGVQVVEPRPVVLTTELPGRTSAQLVAEVRPQVGGIVLRRLFTEGADVQEGQVLYEIDPSTYEAAHANAKATLTRATANHVNAQAAHTRAKTSRDIATAALSRAEANAVPLRLKAERFRELVAIDAVSRQDADDAIAALQRAEAEIQSAEAVVQGSAAEIEGAAAAIQVAAAEIEGAEAALAAAAINLRHTRVTAPIAGRIGKSAVTTGALVTASQPAPLATIQQFDNVYVDVTQSTANLLRLKHSLARGDLRSGGPNRARVRLILEDGSPYPLDGTLEFSDVTVDQGTGSVTLRTVFPNPQHLLLPGMYVRAVLEEGVSEQAILVPQRGVTRDAAGRPVVMVVGAEETVEPRVIVTERTVGDQWLVSEGLTAGDRVILEGLQRARPGTPVKAVPFGSEREATPAAAAQPTPAKT